MATIYRLSLKFIRWIGFKNLATFTLLACGLGSLVFGLELPVFKHQQQTLALICLCGLLFGWFLGDHLRQGWSVGILALGIGGIIILLGIGRLWKPLSVLFSSAVVWLSQVRNLKAWSLESFGDLGDMGVMQAWSYFSQAVFILLSRAWLRLLALAKTQTSYDPLADLVVWAFIVFLLAVWAVWWVRRHGRVLVALLPAGIMLAVNLATSTALVYPLLIWMAAVLILHALVSYFAHQNKWQVRQIDIADIQMEWALTVGILAMASVSSALVIPTISLAAVTEQIGRLNPSWSMTESNTASTFQGSRTIKTAAAPQGLDVYQMLPNDHLLGSGPELSEQVVMWVSLAGYTPMPVEVYENYAGSNPPSPYWRGAVYDRYLGHGWSRSSVKMVEVPAGESLAPTVNTTALPSNTLVRQKVQMASGEGGILYSSGEPISATVPVAAMQLTSGETFGALTESGEYGATSWLPHASADVLRNAGETYPEWVMERYLTLPENLPSRVRELALDLTAVQPTPYDRALAIESYLRTIPYTLELPQPPPVSDLVDYYIFDLQRGFCDYSASAMVVLARAARLPARLVIGYASGVYLPEEARFEVSAANAHAWPEIFFPEIGWVAFEPTGGRPPINRITAASDNQAALEPSTALFPNIRWEFNIRRVVTISLITITLSAIFVFGLTLFDTWWLRRQSPSRAAYLIYRRLRLAGKRSLVKLKPGTTPNEFVDELSQQLINALSIEYPPLVDTLTKRMREIGAIYSQSIYSAHKPGAAEKSEIIRSWISLRYKMVRFLLRNN